MVPLAVERTRWLGELARAIDHAQRLIWEYGSSVGLSVDALDLYARLEVVRDDVDAIRRARGDRPAAPDRIDFPRSEAFESIAR
jgi:hypothetical protein